MHVQVFGQCVHTLSVFAEMLCQMSSPCLQKQSDVTQKSRMKNKNRKSRTIQATLQQRRMSKYSRYILFIIYKLMKYRKILLKINANFQKLYFHKWNIKKNYISLPIFIFQCQRTELQVKHYTIKCKICISSSINFVYNKKNPIFGVNMTFISSHEVKKCIFHSWISSIYSLGKMAFWLSHCFPTHQALLGKGSTLKGKNVILMSKLFPLRIDCKLRKETKSILDRDASLASAFILIKYAVKLTSELALGDGWILCSVSKCFCKASWDERFFMHWGHRKPYQ